MFWLPKEAKTCHIQLHSKIPLNTIMTGSPYFAVYCIPYTKLHVCVDSYELELSGSMGL